MDHLASRVSSDKIRCFYRKHEHLWPVEFWGEAYFCRRIYFTVENYRSRISLFISHEINESGKPITYAGILRPEQEYLGEAKQLAQDFMLTEREDRLHFAWKELNSENYGQFFGNIR